MRVFMLLLTVAILAATVFLQFSVAPPSPHSDVVGEEAADLPRVPQRPEDLPAFEEQMRGFMESAGEERRRYMEEAGL